MNDERARQLGLSTLFDTSRLRLFQTLVNQNYDSSVPYSQMLRGRAAHHMVETEIQVEGVQFTFGIRFPIVRLRYIVEGRSPWAGRYIAPGRYTSKRTQITGQVIGTHSPHDRRGRYSSNVYYGNTKIYAGVISDGGFTTSVTDTTLKRVATKDYNPNIGECMSMEVTIKTLRRIINKVSRANRGLFCLASSGETWNVFSEDASDVTNRFRIVPTIHANGAAGIFYERLYNILFRKKEAVKGVFKDIDEDTVVTLGVTERNCLMIKLGRSDPCPYTEWLLFESDIEAPTPNELPTTLPYQGRRVAQEIVEEPLEKPIEVTEEIQVEEPTHVESETPTLTEEELTRLNLWETAYIRWAETTGQSQASYSTSPTIWFSRYMMEKLRLGESIDELDNQLLSKY